MREFKVGSWASFTNESGNRENGILKKIIPLSNGQTDFERYIYPAIPTLPFRTILSQNNSTLRGCIRV